MLRGDPNTGDGVTGDGETGDGVTGDRENPHASAISRDAPSQRRGKLDEGHRLGSVERFHT
jgi:hypothetical protein